MLKIHLKDEKNNIVSHIDCLKVERQLYDENKYSVLLFLGKLRKIRTIFEHFKNK